MTLSPCFPKTMTAALLVAALAAPALAQTAAEPAGPNEAPTTTDMPGPVALTEAALTLAEFGRAEGDPMVLIGAARALQLVGARPGDGEMGETGAVEADKPGTETAAAAPVDKPAPAAAAADAAAGDLAAGLLDEARLLARGDETVLAAITATGESSTRGSVRGPGYYDIDIDARSYHDIRENFRGGEVAEVAVFGDGDTDLDLAIYDEGGNLICQGTSWGDREYCRWTPSWTGAFTIRVSNYGYVWNGMRVSVN